jgi:hypothetical protein
MSDDHSLSSAMTLAAAFPDITLNAKLALACYDLLERQKHVPVKGELRSITAALGVKNVYWDPFLLTLYHLARCPCVTERSGEFFHILFYALASEVEKERVRKYYVQDCDLCRASSRKRLGHEEWDLWYVFEAYSTDALYSLFQVELKPSMRGCKRLQSLVEGGEEEEEDDEEEGPVRKKARVSDSVTLAEILDGDDDDDDEEGIILAESADELTDAMLIEQWRPLCRFISETVGLRLPDALRYPDMTQSLFDNLRRHLWCMVIAASKNFPNAHDGRSYMAQCRRFYNKLRSPAAFEHFPFLETAWRQVEEEFQSHTGGTGSVPPYVNNVTHPY